MVGIRRLNDARIPTMSVGGAVVRFVGTFYLAVNIPALFPVTRAYVVLVKLRLRAVATVERCSLKCFAARRTKRWTAR